MKQNMGKGKAKGTVLFTVITVMMVMVVLLMTTLTLTSAAHRRSYYTYFQSQAQYAAQNAIDAVTYSAYTRQDFHDWVVEHVTEDDEDTHFINLEFAGSQIQYTSGEPVVECTIERLHPDVKWDEATSALHSRAMWKITATARVGHGRNESEATVSQYLYENFQVAAEDLGLPATNLANWTVWTPPEEGEGEEYEEGIPLAHAPGYLVFGNKGYCNNMVTLGPAYGNLVTLPLGWGNYDDAGAAYTLENRNNRMRSVGNTIFVNNITSKVKMRTDFQSPREGAVYYGNVGLENEGYSWISKVKDTVTNSGKNYYEDNSNYVYIDGVLGTLGNSGHIEIGKRTAYDGEPAYGSTRPVNLYCGGINVPRTGNYLTVQGGDVTMYDPNINSVWIENEGTAGSAVSKFVALELYKGWGGYSTDPEGNDIIGGNIYCNNNSLSLGGGNGSFVVEGNIIMTKPGSTLTLNRNVTVNGHVYSAGSVSNSGPTPAERIHQVSAEYYELMPFYNRIDEVFEKYYRWDLRTESATAASGFISDDYMIVESTNAGHNWEVAAFNTPTGTVYVPYTTPVNPEEHRWIIPEHKYYSQADAAGSMMPEATGLPTSFETFTSGLPAYGSASVPAVQQNVKILSHDTTGELQDSDVNNLYVITKSCVIDLTESRFNTASFFVDPSRGSGLIKVGIKGASGVSGNLKDNAFAFIVNNTAHYGEAGYMDPEAYAELEGEAFKAVQAVECEVMLDNSFAAKQPLFTTTGAWYQIWSNNLSIVQNPTFPSSKADLDGWSGTDDTKYAYELVPNFTVFSRAPRIEMTGNGGLFNCDLVAPMSTLVVNTFNYTGDQNVVYREYCDSIATEGKSYLWGIGCMMIENIDTTTDQNAVYAYIKGTGRKLKEPPEEPGTRNSNGASQALGDNRNAFFNNDHIGY